jgi:hypothetical protein
LEIRKIATLTALVARGLLPTSTDVERARAITRRRPLPISACPVVTGSGFGGVKEMLLPIFGEALAHGGVATFAAPSESAGAPRRQLPSRRSFVIRLPCDRSRDWRAIF